MSKQTADSGMSWTAMMGSFCRFLGSGMLWISCRDALRMSLLHSRCKLTSVQMESFHVPRTLSLITSVFQSASGLWSQCHRLCGASDSPDSVQPLSLSRKQPSSFHFFLLLSLLKHSRQTPHPPPPKPLSLVRLLLNASPPSVAAVYLLSSVYPQHKAHADTQAALCTLSRRRSRGCNLHQWCPTVSGAPAGNADAHLSAQKIQRKETPPSEW